MAKYINPYTDFGFKKLFGEEQRRMYEENLFQYWGMKSALETAVQENKIEIAKNLIALNLDDATIAKGTGLSIEQIEALRIAKK